MKNDASSQVRDLQAAILQRARALQAEHIQQGQMTRSRIMDDVRDKVRLMEQKELLAARDQAERDFQRRVQASEIQLQAELDRNRWGLVQSVLDRMQQQIGQLCADREAYEPVFRQLLAQGVRDLGISKQIAVLNPVDHKHFAADWRKMVDGLDAEVVLSENTCACRGGVKLLSEDGDMMVDNTFEGLADRREDELMRVIFEHLFSRVPSMGVISHG